MESGKFKRHLKTFLEHFNYTEMNTQSFNVCLYEFILFNQVYSNVHINETVSKGLNSYTLDIDMEIRYFDYFYIMIYTHF